MLTVGSLFAGIGGFDLAATRCGMRVAWQVEIDEWCRRVLTKHWPDVPKFADIREVAGDELEPVDLICGGFPCQPFSVAGRRLGQKDDRALWPEMLRIVRNLQPRWVIGENVPGLINLGLDQVCADLEGAGYEVWTLGIPAVAVGAPHIRERLWIVAHAERAERGPGESAGNVADRGWSLQVAEWKAAGKRRPSGAAIGSSLKWDPRLIEEYKRTRGNLNPEWVEWLMGYPIGWTALEGSGTR